MQFHWIYLPTFVGLKNGSYLRLQHFKKSRQMGTELEIETITASEHKNGNIARIGNEYIGQGKKW